MACARAGRRRASSSRRSLIPYGVPYLVWLSRARPGWAHQEKECVGTTAHAILPRGRVVGGEVPTPLLRRRWGGGGKTARWCGLHRLGTRWRPVLIRPFVPLACPEHDQDDRAEGNKRDEPPPPGLPGVVEPASAHREVRDDEPRTATPMTIPNATPATFISASSHGRSPRPTEPMAINGTMGAKIAR
jgi:hypothetical protein